MICALFFLLVSIILLTFAHNMVVIMVSMAPENEKVKLNIQKI